MVQHLILLISIYYLDLTCDVIPPRRSSGSQHIYVLIHLSAFACTVLLHSEYKSTVLPSVLGCGPNRRFGIYPNIFVLLLSFFVLFPGRHIGLPEDLKGNGAKIRLYKCD